MALLARSPAQLSAARPSCSRPAAARRLVLARNAPATAVEQATAVVSIDAESYESIVASHTYVCVDYYTDWCGPCKMIAPHLEAMAAEMPHIKFTKLNCTTDPAAKKIAMAQGIKALPTFHMFRKGERAGVFVGGKPNQLRKFLDDYAA